MVWKQIKRRFGGVAGMPPGATHASLAGAPDALEAERLAAGLPKLSIDALHVSASISNGAHGRRQAGHGDSFWQYRPVLPGEPVSRIDWRQSARSERAFVRETEREAAQTVCLWVDRTPSMGWRSAASLPLKSERAALLALASAAMVLRVGERARLLDGAAHVTATTRQRLPDLAAALGSPRTDDAPDELLAGVPRDGLVILFGDFLDPPESWQTRLRAVAARPAQAILVQVLDPAELDLPWSGRIRFEGLEGEERLLVPRTDDLRGAYRDALAQHRAALAAIAARSGARLLTHRTDTAPETGLRAIYQALAGHHATTAAPAPDAGAQP